MTENAATILIADDIEANRMILSDLCESLGYRFVLAENGKQALDQMKGQAPDIALLDINMPEMTGIQVLEQMHADEALRHVPTIMITAVDEISTVVHCIEEGADDYLLKPFNTRLLEARLDACLEKKRLRDREQELHADLESSYQSLQEAERIRDALSHMIVHDLNNPLTSVLGYSQMLLRGVTDEEKLKRYASQILKSGEEMASLIRGILDVSKMESGDMPVEMSPVDVVDMVGGICEQFAPHVAANDVRLTFDRNEKPIEANADKELLGRVVQNLLSNALKHTAKGTAVSIAIREEPADAVITVADNGQGIPKEYQDKVFDKFFQVQSREEGKQYGVGLGLAFCRMAIEAQGGRIRVESEAGQGAQFIVELARQSPAT